jgi:hypothetical protein
MHQQLWGYKVEEKLYLGVREQKRLNTAVLQCAVGAHCRYTCTVVPRFTALRFAALFNYIHIIIFGACLALTAVTRRLAEFLFIIFTFTS